jgi:hypothetical protein
MNNRKIGGFFNPKLFGTELKMTDQVKYLGVILDMKLDWKAHLENRIRIACIAYWHCRSTECVDLVAPFSLLMDLFARAASAGVFSDILNVRESYALGFHAMVF